MSCQALPKRSRRDSSLRSNLWNSSRSLAGVSFSRVMTHTIRLGDCVFDVKYAGVIHATRFERASSVNSIGRCVSAFAPFGSVGMHLALDSVEMRNLPSPSFSFLYFYMCVQRTPEVLPIQENHNHPLDGRVPSVHVHIP